MSASPRASPPATALVQFVKGEKKVLKGKEAVSFCLQIYANWIFNPNFAIMIGESFNFNIHKNVFAMA